VRRDLKRGFSDEGGGVGRGGVEMRGSGNQPLDGAQAWVRSLREPHALIGEIIGTALAAIVKVSSRWGRRPQGMEGCIASNARQ
jgi:hypothetical protein